MKLINQIFNFLSVFLHPINRAWKKINESTQTYLIIFVLCSLFIGFGYSYIDYEYYNYGFIPLLFLGVLLFYYQLDKVLYLVAFLTPFSINTLISESTSISILTEPFLIVFTILYLIKFFLDGNYNTKILKHPMSIAIYFYLIWMIITSFTSTHQLVSFKYVFSKIVYIIPYFIAIIPIFKDVKKIKTFYILYSISLAIIVIISSLKFALRGFEFQYSFYIMQPFYNDHTAYGAILALFIPLSLYYIISKEISKPQKLFFLLLLFIFISGLILSYSRAAWLSIIPAIGIYLILKFKIKLRLIFYLMFFGAFIFFAFQTPILQILEKNNQDSSGNITEHISSISNITTDASNVERLNRWFCVFRMFKEKPVFGWGPGTYQFEYAGFQKSYQLSTISTNAGNLGNAHSEYFGALADSGVLGMASVLILFLTTLSIGIKVYKHAIDDNIKLLALYLTMSLVTYYTHGVLNNFLDTDKLSIPFWMFTAAILALDVYSRKDKQLHR
ncbi:MAG: O-antigen ligase family protein [Bacteroidales bacterium]